MSNTIENVTVYQELDQIVRENRVMHGLTTQGLYDAQTLLIKWAQKLPMTTINKRRIGTIKRTQNINSLRKFASHIQHNLLEGVMVQRRNMMSGELYWEAANTPNCCSPASETYWSM